jgi:hypothetical protein
MDEDAALALGCAVTLTLICLSCFAWGLHNTFIANRITVEDSTSLLGPDKLSG